MHGQAARERREGSRRSTRRRWFRVRVETDEGAYVGSLRLAGPAGTLRALIDDERTYLALWDVTEERSGAREDHLAIHKVAIRNVVLLGSAREHPAAGAEA
jgi:hypothetical protein